ncbi:hypothetical protein EON65_57955 [archaeon]|nr:MAG: hypothetical protein EON65_57955 [archaeon]
MLNVATVIPLHDDTNMQRAEGNECREKPVDLSSVLVAPSCFEFNGLTYYKGFKSDMILLDGFGRIAYRDGDLTEEEMIKVIELARIISKQTPSDWCITYACPCAIMMDARERNRSVQAIRYSTKVKVLVDSYCCMISSAAVMHVPDGPDDPNTAAPKSAGICGNLLSCFSSANKAVGHVASNIPL